MAQPTTGSELQPSDTRSREQFASGASTKVLGGILFAEGTVLFLLFGTLVIFALARDRTRLTPWAWRIAGAHVAVPALATVAGVALLAHKRWWILPAVLSQALGFAYIVNEIAFTNWEGASAVGELFVATIALVTIVNVALIVRSVQARG